MSKKSKIKGTIMRIIVENNLDNVTESINKVVETYPNIKEQAVKSSIYTLIDNGYLIKSDRGCFKITDELLCLDSDMINDMFVNEYRAADGEYSLEAVIIKELLDSLIPLSSASIVQRVTKNGRNVKCVGKCLKRLVSIGYVSKNSRGYYYTSWDILLNNKMREYDEELLNTLREVVG